MRSPVLLVLSLLTLLLSAIVAFRAWQFVKTPQSSCDLRCRTVGSRLIGTGNSPYFYKWTTGDPDRLLDPNDPPERVVNGNVSTPATLILLYPLSALNYQQVKIAWLILQWLAAAVTLWLMSRGSYQRSLETTVITAAVLLTSTAWLYHLERGQIYVFYALAMALSYTLFNVSFRGSLFLSGLVAGLLIFFRPFAGTLGLVFLFDKRRAGLYGWFSGLLIGLLIFIAPVTHQWRDYFTAMKDYNLWKETTKTITINPVIPTSIEDGSATRHLRYFPVESLNTVQYYAGKLMIPVKQNSLSLFYILIAAALIGLFCFRNKLTNERRLSADQRWLMAFLLVILAELFLVLPRGGYNVMQWLFALPLIIRIIKPSTTITIAVTTLFLVLNFIAWQFPREAAIGELSMIGLSIYSLMKDYFNFRKS